MKAGGNRPIFHADESADCTVASTSSTSSIESTESNHDITSENSLKVHPIKSIDEGLKSSRTKSTSSATASKRINEKKVRFGSLEVHEHAVELGGPGVPFSGPSTTLEWKEQSYFMIKSVEAFEDSRPFSNRRGSDLLQTDAKRIGMLLDAGHTLKEINRCIRENERIRDERWRTFRKYDRFSSLFKIFGL